MTTVDLVRSCKAYDMMVCCHIYSGAVSKWVHAEHERRKWRLHQGLRMVLQSPSSRVVSDLSLNRSGWVIGLIMGHGHLRKHLHRVSILREDQLCRICDEQEEIAEHLLFDCPAIARKHYAIFGHMDKGGDFPQEDLIGCFRRFIELLKL
ncbi:hypothetical protein J6590_063549 [Homalodisca vitripennis]|nr:hypothetical protein J6590_063549 [Homalodisca vitripennis]